MLRRGNALDEPDVDYVVQPTTPNPTIQFRVPTSGLTQVQFTTTNPSLDNAHIALSVDDNLVPVDGNTLGGIPFSQLTSTTVSLDDKI